MAGLLLACFGLSWSKANEIRVKRNSRKSGSREYDDNFADMQAANARRVSQQKSTRSNSIRHMEDPAFTGMGAPPSYDAAVKERGNGGGGGSANRGDAGPGVGGQVGRGGVPLTPQLSPSKRVAENDFA